MSNPISVSKTALVLPFRVVYFRPSTLKRDCRLDGPFKVPWTTDFNQWPSNSNIFFEAKYDATHLQPFQKKNTIALWRHLTNILDDLVYVFYLAVAFFALCAIVMLPIPLIMRRKRNAESQKENRDNREDGEYYHGST